MLADPSQHHWSPLAAVPQALQSLLAEHVTVQLPPSLSLPPLLPLEEKELPPLEPDVVPSPLEPELPLDPKPPFGFALVDELPPHEARTPVAAMNTTDNLSAIALMRRPTFPINGYSERAYAIRITSASRGREILRSTGQIERRG